MDVVEGAISRDVLNLEFLFSDNFYQLRDDTFWKRGIVLSTLAAALISGGQ